MLHVEYEVIGLHVILKLFKCM